MELAAPFACGMPQFFSQLESDPAGHGRNQHQCCVFNELQNSSVRVTELELLPLNCYAGFALFTKIRFRAPLLAKAPCSPGGELGAPE